MSKFIKAVASAALLATSATGSAQAAALSTDVDVTLPSIIALYCYDKVEVNVDAAGFVAATGAVDHGSTTAAGGAGLGDTGQLLASTAGGGWNVDADASSSVPGVTLTNTVDLTMTGVCAFRALATSAGVNVAIAAAGGGVTDGGDITHAASGAVIEATDVQLVVGGAVDADDNYDVTTGLGLANVNPINVRLPLDLSAATVAGTYTSTDLFTVTVSAL